MYLICLALSSSVNATKCFVNASSVNATTILQLNAAKIYAGAMCKNGMYYNLEDIWVLSKPLAAGLTGLVWLLTTAFGTKSFGTYYSLKPCPLADKSERGMPQSKLWVARTGNTTPQH